MITKQRVTIKDIAKRAGISHQAVSYVLNDKMHMVGAGTRQKVLGLVKEMGYIPNHQARSLKTNRSNCIGVFYPSVASTHAYFSSAVSVINQQLAEYGNRATLLGEYTNAQAAVTAVQSGQVDGLIYFLVAHQLENFKETVAPVLKNEGVPFVVLHGTSSVPMDFHNVGFDNGAAGYAAAMRLIDAGFRRIGYVSRFRKHPIPVAEAVEGHLQALAEHGLADNADHIFDDDGIKAGYDAVMSMRAGGTPFGLNCFNGEVAMTAVKAVHDAGLTVGKEVGLVYGGPELLDPELLDMMAGCPVPHVRQNTAGRSAGAVRMLMSIIERKNDVPERVIFGTDISA